MGGSPDKRQGVKIMSVEKISAVTIACARFSVAPLGLSLAGC